MRKTFCGSSSLGEAKLDALRFHELEQTFAVSAHVAIDFGERRKVFAVGLGNVENIDGPESVQASADPPLLRLHSVRRSLHPSCIVFRPSGRE